MLIDRLDALRGSLRHLIRRRLIADRCAFHLKKCLVERSLSPCLWPHHQSSRTRKNRSGLLGLLECAVYMTAARDSADD